MSHQVATVKREAVASCMTCPLCNKLFRDATTIIECLHTFCRKCIYKKLSEEEVECCPICKIDLGCVPMEKLRPDHSLQDVRCKIFPSKRIKLKAPETVTTVTIPAKRKERSLSSLVVSTPRVSAQAGLTARRSNLITKKVTKGSSFTIEKHIEKEDGSTEDQYESSSSPEMASKSGHARHNSASSEPLNLLGSDVKKKNEPSDAWEAKVDLWKPLNYLVEAANRSKSSKLSCQGSGSKPEAPLHAQGMDGLGVNKAKNKEYRQKSKLEEEKNHSDRAIPDAGKPKKFRKILQKTSRKFGDSDSRFHPQVLDAGGSKFNYRNHPIWFALISDVQLPDIPRLPQIPSVYLRVKDGSIPVSFLQKYVRIKLNLPSEDEIEIRCKGRLLIPSLTLNDVHKHWFQTTATSRVSASIGSSAKEFVMVLGYCRRVLRS